jgi:GPI mannosyltransferase 3
MVAGTADGMSEAVSAGAAEAAVSNSCVSRWLIGIIFFGIGLRVVAAIYSQGFYHPDEHQQYLEVAQGFVYGCHLRFWEEVRGTRCYIYPGMLAGVLCLLDDVGVRDPVLQANTIRLLLSLSIFGCLLLFARRWLREGHRIAAYFLVTAVALSPDLIFISLRTLSETVIIIPLLLAFYILRRRPLIAGLLCGLMFGIRFQSALFTAALGIIALYEDVGRTRLSGNWNLTGRIRLSRLLSLRMAVGLTIAILGVGLVDKLTLGDWFHSPLACFRANIEEGIAAKYGIYPFARYFTWARGNLLHISPFVFPLLLLGAFREPRLAFIAFLGVLGHSFIAHKEYRFIWPVLPLFFLMIALGFEMAYTWLGRGWHRQYVVTIGVLSLLVGVAWRSWEIQWNPDPSRSSSLALAKLGHWPGVTGVALYGIGESGSGNYFYLRRNIPLLTEPNRKNEDRRTLSICKANLRQHEDTVNYLVTPPWNVILFAEWHPEKIEITHGIGIYKLHPSGHDLARTAAY